MTEKITEYIVQVDNAKKEGHPIQIIEYVEQVAAEAFDGLCEQFPYENVRFFTVTKTEVRTRKAGIKNLPAICPLGHMGEVDGKQIVFRNSNGFVNCRICGYVGE